MISIAITDPVNDLETGLQSFHLAAGGPILAGLARIDPESLDLEFHGRTRPDGQGKTVALSLLIKKTA